MVEQSLFVAVLTQLICENKHKLNNNEAHVARKTPSYLL